MPAWPVVGPCRSSPWQHDAKAKGRARIELGLQLAACLAQDDSRDEAADLLEALLRLAPDDARLLEALAGPRATEAGGKAV